MITYIVTKEKKNILYREQEEEETLYWSSRCL